MMLITTSSSIRVKPRARTTTGLVMEWSFQKMGVAWSSSVTRREGFDKRGRYEPNPVWCSVA